MAEKNLVTGTPILLGGYQVSSTQGDIELEQSHGLVRGNGLLVKNAEGEVLYEGVRGFLPFTNETHLVRRQDGSWWLLFLSTGKKRKLQKVNVKHGDMYLMFDDEGKIRPDQECYRYPVIAA